MMASLIAASFALAYYVSRPVSTGSGAPDEGRHPWDAAVAGGPACPHPTPDCEDDRDLMLEDPPLYGDDVKELQVCLKARGFYRGPANALFGPETDKAVRAYQKSAGLLVTGVLTRDMWYALSPGPPPPPPGPKPEEPQGVVSIAIDTRKLLLTIMVDGKPFRKYPCAVGKPSTPTPVGDFMVANKWSEPGGPFGARWMGLSIPWGTYGIHGTSNPGSIGTTASSGCIRMFDWHVCQIFPWIKVGTEVTILGAQPTTGVYRNLKLGAVGTDVQFTQYKMRQAGFLPGPVDGRFGERLLEVVLEIQRYYGLPMTGVIGPNELHVLGIR